MHIISKITAAVWQNPNGTWSHHRDASGEFAGEASARIDLRFTEEWAR